MVWRGGLHAEPVFNHLTGCYASRCTHPEFLLGKPSGGPASVEFNVWLDGTMPTMGGILRGAGYRTGFAGKWHNSPHAEALGCERLDPAARPSDPSLDEALARRQEILCAEVARVGGYDFVDGVLWENPTEEPLEALRVHHLEWSLGHALEFLDAQDADQPFFLHYASTCYHGPNIVDTVEDHDMLETPAGRIPVPPAGAIPRAEWRNICAKAGLPFNHESISFLWLDQELRVLTEALRRKGLLDNTILVFAGDHGNELGKGTCYDTVSRIPIVMAGPGLPAGAVFDEFAQNADILPTLLGLVGLPAPVGIDGRDLAAVWRGESPARDEVYMENGFSRSLRTESWKYIAKSRPGNLREVTGPDGSHLLRDHYGATWEFPALRIAAALHPGYFHCEELYNLTDDPLEQRNLAADPAFHEALSDMRRRFGAIQQSLPDAMTAPDGWNPDARIIISTMEKFGTQSVPWWPDAESRCARHFVDRNFS